MIAQKFASNLRAEGKGCNSGFGGTPGLLPMLIIKNPAAAFWGKRRRRGS